MLLRNGDVLSPVRWMHTRPLLPLARWSAPWTRDRIVKRDRERGDR